jgi:hypothetical protein
MINSNKTIYAILTKDGRLFGPYGSKKALQRALVSVMCVHGCNAKDVQIVELFESDLEFSVAIEKKVALLE